MVIERKKQNAKEYLKSYLILYQRNKQKANCDLYLSPCFCQHNEKAKEQHSLSKHGLEPLTGKGLMQESERAENHAKTLN